MKQIRSLLPLCALLSAAALPVAASGQSTNVTYAVVHSFSAQIEGAYPAPLLTPGADGNYYGITTSGGSNGDNFGTAFQVTPAGVQTTIHVFTQTEGSPSGILTLGADGNFYGVTARAYRNNDTFLNNGNIFSLTPSGTLTILHGFADTDTPESSRLLFGSDGAIYGEVLTTTTSTATPPVTTNTYSIFRVTTAGIYSILHSFAMTEGTPQPTLVTGSEGDIWGTTLSGGTNSQGSIFRVTPAGAFTVIHSFTEFTDGENPYAPLVLAPNGNLYGSTEYGGDSSGYGTVFSVTPAGVVTTLHTFDFSDGSFPLAQLLLASNGSLYGTTADGGTDDDGTVFSITTAGAFTLIHSFADYNDGSDPGSAALVQASDGNIYGTTGDGGTVVNMVNHYYGLVYQINPTTGVYNPNIYNFASGENPSQSASGLRDLTPGANASVYVTDTGGGSADQGEIFSLTAAGVRSSLFAFESSSEQSVADYGLVTGTDGNVYGETSSRNTGDLGTIFQVTPAGVFATIYTLPENKDTSGNNLDTSTFSSPLVAGADGNLYGAVSAGFGTDNGAIFRVSTAGAETTLYTFTSPDASGPDSLVRDPSGDLFGSTSAGTVFELTPTGALSTVAVIDVSEGNPPFELTLGASGNLFGLSGEGSGITEGGSFFSLTPTGTFTQLHAFASYEGADPDGAPLLDSDGNFYVTATDGGPNGAGDGSILRIAPDGTTSTLYAFSGADGSDPNGGLILGKDGNFYGVTGGGGANDLGTVFRLSADGTLSTIYSFTEDGGYAPRGPLAQAADGSLFGVTSAGGTGDNGGVFHISLTPPVVTTTVKGSGTTSESGGSAKIYFTLDRASVFPLVVSFKLGGTAVLNDDYNFSSDATAPITSDSITIPAGTLSVKVKAKAIDNTVVDGTRTIVLKLKASTAGDYVVGAPSKAKVSVLDND